MSCSEASSGEERREIVRMNKCLSCEENEEEDCFTVKWGLNTYISFFHLLVNGFSVIIIIRIIIRFFRQVFSECTEAITTSLIH